MAVSAAQRALAEKQNSVEAAHRGEFAWRDRYPRDNKGPEAACGIAAEIVGAPLTLTAYLFPKTLALRQPHQKGPFHIATPVPLLLSSLPPSVFLTPTTTHRLAVMSFNSKQALLSTPLHGLYIPAGLLVVGAAIIDRNYVPYAIGLAMILGVFKVLRGSKRRVFFTALRI